MKEITHGYHNDPPDDLFFAWMEQRYDHYRMACERAGEDLRSFVSFIWTVEPERCKFFLGEERKTWKRR